MSSIAADAGLACPRDDRKSAALASAEAGTFGGATMTAGLAGAREILRSPDVRQAGGNSASVASGNPDHVSFFFLDGDGHRKRRASVAGYFTPKAIVTRYHPIINATMDRLVDRLQTNGSAVLDEMALELAVNVTVEILGTAHDGNPLNFAYRLQDMRRTAPSPYRSAVKRFVQDRVFGRYFRAKRERKSQNFYDRHVAPAVEARRSDPKDDVVSYMVKEGYSKASMIMECMTYGTAGVSTTREFIGMAAWHLFDCPELKETFLNSDEDGQFAILQEILRLDPVASVLYRRAAKDMPDAKEGPIQEGELMAISIRNANVDPESVGECPFSFDAGRAAKTKNIANYMTFGDGPHRCPGSQVALHEGRMFLDRLFRIPGLRLEKPPKMLWDQATQGYEIRETVVACDPKS
jgi:cytochrome P450